MSGGNFFRRIFDPDHANKEKSVAQKKANEVLQQWQLQFQHLYNQLGGVPEQLVEEPALRVGIAEKIENGLETFVQSLTPQQAELLMKQIEINKEYLRQVKQDARQEQELIKNIRKFSEDQEMARNVRLKNILIVLRESCKNNSRKKLAEEIAKSSVSGALKNYKSEEISDMLLVLASEDGVVQQGKGTENKAN